MHIRISHVAIGAALALSAASALAQTASGATGSGNQRYYMPYERNFWSYAGAAIGRSDYDIGCSAGFGCDTKATAGKIFAGGKFNEFGGVEASYVYLGNADRNGGDTWGQGINLSLVGTLPLGQSIGLNGKVGAIYGWTRTEGPSTPGFAAGHDNGLGLSYGVGLNFAVTRTVDLRLDWDRYRMKFTTGRDDVDLATVGVAFKF